MRLIPNKISKQKLEGQLSNQFFATKQYYHRELVILNSKNSLEFHSDLELSEETKIIIKKIVKFLIYLAEENKEGVNRMIQTSPPAMQYLLQQFEKYFGLTLLKIFIILCFLPEIVLSSSVVPVPAKRLFLITLIFMPKIVCLDYLAREIYLLGMPNAKLGFWGVPRGTNLTPSLRILQNERQRSILLILTLSNFILNEIIYFSNPNPYQMTIHRTITKLLPIGFFISSQFKIYSPYNPFRKSLQLMIAKDFGLIVLMIYCLALPSVTGAFLLLANDKIINPKIIRTLVEIGNSDHNHQVSTQIRSTSKGSKSKTFHIDLSKRQNEVKTSLPTKKNNLAPEISPKIDKIYKDSFPEKLNMPPVK